LTELQQTMQRALDGLAEKPRETGDWGRVVADAERRSQRAWVMRVAVVAAAAVVAVAAALVSPVEDEQPTSVIGRALAAVGDGPVLHVVFRSDLGTAFVRLSTGEVTPVYAEVELRYDPDRGAHYVTRFGGVVTGERSIPPGELPDAEIRRYRALAARYRQELASGAARVVADGRVGGRRVAWIRLRGQWWPDRQDGVSHLHAEEIAVDRETYKPVFVRQTRDGRPVPGWPGEHIRELELLPSGQGDFEGSSARSPQLWPFSQRFGSGLDRTGIDRLIPGGGVWAGPSIRGLPLADVRELIMTTRTGPKAPRSRTVAASVFYGRLARGHRDASRRHLVIEQAPAFPRAWGWAARGVAIPDGSAFVWANRTAFLRDERRSILIRATTTEDILAAAFSLRPFGTSRDQPGTLDVQRIARKVERPQIPAVEGFAPVRPRPLVRRRGTRIQSGAARGVTVAIFSGGVATFDTTGMDERIRKVVGKTVSANCIRVTNGTGGSGAGGEVPTNGVKDVVMLAQPQRGRVPIVRGRFDFCELSTGLGRNWLRRNGWHGLLEVPLTTRGTRFLDERAAVRAARAKRN
jgi:hypothetical protein